MGERKTIKKMKSESEREEDIIGWGERKIGEVQKYLVL